MGLKLLCEMEVGESGVIEQIEPWIADQLKEQEIEVGTHIKVIAKQKALEFFLPVLVTIQTKKGIVTLSEAQAYMIKVRVAEMPRYPTPYDPWMPWNPFFPYWWGRI